MNANPKCPRRCARSKTRCCYRYLGTAALEVREAMGLMALDNLDAFFDGHEVPNRVG